MLIMSQRGAGLRCLGVDRCRGDTCVALTVRAGRAGRDKSRPYKKGESMRRLIAVCLVLSLAVAGSARADATTTPASAPATAPTTQQFPTVAELVAKFKETKQAKVAMLKVAYIDLSTPVGEKPADFFFFGESDGTTLRSIISRLH